ncbi:hypothetical protein [Winogradskyella sp. PG-2]|uniref:hypothetical protein n=1 Tax=Winogradskyella sp. PG-2 TaxID=754409 RepID=UPI0004588C7E|nr:hypothetical protein [Winogradskyella sp. PG-2]BAO76980.1 hypothetical protein WPG_2750 [Winogradskyella sp. PG-2]
MKTKYILCVFLFTSLINCGSKKNAINPDDKLIGDWSLVAEATPQGDVPITMTITKNEMGTFKGSFQSIMGDFTMSNLVLKDGNISCNFDVQGATFEFKVVFLMTNLQVKH